MNRSVAGSRRPAGATAWPAFRLAALAACLLALPASAQTPSGRGALSLARAVALARATYPSLGAARAGAQAAAAAVGLATSDRWPQLSGRAALTQFEEAMLVRPLHSLDIRTTPPEFDETLVRTDVSLSWTLYAGGATGARVRGARADAAGAAAIAVATEMALTTQVARAYLDVLTARGVLDAEVEHIAALTAEQARVQQLLDQGRAARVELLRVQAALAEADAERVAKATRLDLAERSLARFVSLPADSTRAAFLIPVRLVPAALPEDRAALVEQARSANPDLQRAREAVESARAAHRAAQAEWIPRLDASGSWLGYGSTSSAVSQEWQAGVSVFYPLFTAGARRSMVGRTGAEARRAQDELRLAELQTEQEVDQAANSVLAARSLVTAVDLTVQSQTEVVRIERLSLEAGAGTQTDYLNAQSDLLRVRSALVQAQNGEIAAHVELARVLGELTPEWIDRNLEIVP